MLLYAGSFLAHDICYKGFFSMIIILVFSQIYEYFVAKFFKEANTSKTGGFITHFHVLRASGAQAPFGCLYGGQELAKWSKQ